MADPRYDPQTVLELLSEEPTLSPEDRRTIGKIRRGETITTAEQSSFEKLLQSGIGARVLGVAASGPNESAAEVQRAMATHASRFNKDEVRSLAAQIATNKFGGDRTTMEGIFENVSRMAEVEQARRQALISSSRGKRLSTKQEAQLESIGSSASSSFGRLHQNIRGAVRDISGNRDLTPQDKERALERLRSEVGSLGSEKMESLQKSGLSSVVPALDRLRSQIDRDVADAQRQVSREFRTEWVKQVEFSAAPVKVDEEGNVQQMSTQERLASVETQAANFRQQYRETAPGTRKSLLGRTLQDAEAARYRLRVAGTREEASSIAEQSVLMPEEREPGQWHAAPLITQRDAAMSSLKGAQLLKQTLGVDAAPEQQKTANDLLRKMVDRLARIDDNIARGQEALKTAQVQSPFTSLFMKRKPGEEDTEFAERLGKQGAWNRAIGTAIFSTANAGVQATAAIKEMTFDMPRRTAGLASAVEGTQQGQFLDALSFSAQSRARFGGDILFGDRTLGRSGFDFANKAAGQEMDRRKNAEGWGLAGSGMGALAGVGQILGGIGAIGVGGWTGVGGILGAGLIASGVSSLTGSFTSAAQNTRLQESGALDFAGPFSGFAGATRNAQFQQSRDALMNQAMERNRVNIAGQEAYEQSLDTWGANIRSAGAWAVNPQDLIKARSSGINQKGVADAERKVFDDYIESVRRTSMTPEGEFTAKKMDSVIEGANAAATVERNQQRLQNIRDNAQANQDQFFAKYGMSAEEWSTKASAVNAQMGAGMGRIGAAGGEKAAQNLYGMGLAGVGSFEQLAGNAAQLASMTGRTDATGDLRKILTDAVRLGFDNSRTGQAFVQTTTNLAGQLGIRGATEVSTSLSRMTRLMGGTEQDMAMAARGMAQLPSMFEQNKTVGGLNLASFVAGGGLELQGPASQWAFEISKSPQRALKVQADIDRLQKARGKRGDNATTIEDVLKQQEFQDIDPMLRDRLLQGGFEGLKEFGQAATTGVRTMQGLSGVEGETKKLIEDIRKGRVKGADARRSIQQMRIRGTGLFLDTGATYEQAQAASLTALFGGLSEEDKKELDKQIGSRGNFASQEEQGKLDAQSAAQIRQQQAAGKAGLLAGGAFEARQKLELGDIDKLAINGKVRFQSGGATQEISAERAKAVAAGSAAKDPVETKFATFMKETTKLQAAMQQQMITSLESVMSGKTQQVYVMNFGELISDLDKTGLTIGQPGTAR
jgi:hypothetical protein